MNRSFVLLCAAVVAVVTSAFVGSGARAGEKVGLSAEDFKKRLEVYLSKEADLPQSVKDLAAKVKAKLQASDVAYQPGKKVTWTVAGTVDKKAAEAYLREVVRDRFVAGEGINQATFDKLQFVIEARAAGAGSGSNTVATGSSTTASESGCCGCGFFGRLFRRCR